MARKKKDLELLEDLKKMSWKDYIKSRYWRRLSKSLLDDDECVCAFCGRPRWSKYKVGKNKGKRKPKPNMRMNVHHKHYDSLGEETKEDVIILCGSEHTFWHDLHTLAKSRKGIYEEMYEIFKEKIGWDYKKFGK